MGILMRCSSFRLLLVAVAAAFHTPPVGGSRQAVAAEVAPVDALPADTNQIKRLTPEQATALAGSKGKGIRGQDVAEPLIGGSSKPPEIPAFITSVEYRIFGDPIIKKSARLRHPGHTEIVIAFVYQCCRVVENLKGSACEIEICTKAHRGAKAKSLTQWA